MKSVVELITISELSRLIGISRPTLYKYIKDFESDDYSELGYDIVMLFKFIVDDNTITKEQIYEYCNEKFRNNSSDALLDKIKVYIKKSDRFKEINKLLLENIEQLEDDEYFEELKETLNRKEEN